MKKSIITLALLLCGMLTTVAQIRWNQRYQQYIDQYKDMAVEQMLRWKVPASITLAQGLLESAAGQSYLATKGNAHFGIKCHGWKGRTLYRTDELPDECFRAYNSVYESYEDHSRFLAQGQRYSSLFKLKITDYKGWAHGLKAAGYASAPTYAQSLIDIIQLYKLYELDKATSYDHFMIDHARQEAGSDGQPLHPIGIYNKNYYLYVREGDTFKSLAKETGISYRKLAKYNERDKNDRLEPGEVIWLKKKQTKAPKEYKNRHHFVKDGESMYSIAQKYGIRLKNLYKMNHLSPDYSIRVGDELRVR